MSVFGGWIRKEIPFLCEGKYGNLLNLPGDRKNAAVNLLYQFVNLFYVLSMSSSIHLWEEKYSCLRTFWTVKWLDCVKELLAVLAILYSLYGGVCVRMMWGQGVNEWDINEQAAV
jgi:hypothetical protein